MNQFKFVPYDGPPASFGHGRDSRKRRGPDGTDDHGISHSSPADVTQPGIEQADSRPIDNADESDTREAGDAGNEGADALTAPTLAPQVANTNDTLEPSPIRHTLIDLSGEDSDDEEVTHADNEHGSVPTLPAPLLVKATPDRSCGLSEEGDTADDGSDAEAMSIDRQPSVTDCTRTATLEQPFLQSDVVRPPGPMTDEGMDGEPIPETDLDVTMSDNDDDDDDGSDYREPSRSPSTASSEALSETLSAADFDEPQATMSSQRFIGAAQRHRKTVTRSQPLKPGDGITKHYARPEQTTQSKLFLSILKQFAASAATSETRLSFTIGAEIDHDGSLKLDLTPCRGVQQAPRSPLSSQSPSNGGKRFTFEEDEFLRRHKGELDLPWEEIHKLHCRKFGPTRSRNTLQVHYCKKVKGTCLSDRNPKSREGDGSRPPNSDTSSRSIVSLLSPEPSAHDSSDIDLVPDFNEDAIASMPSSRPNPLLALPIPFSDEDVHHCNICGLPINAKQLQKMQNTRFSRIKIKLCDKHNRQAAERYWQQGGYPDIEWDCVEANIRFYLDTVRRLLDNLPNCHSYNKLLELLENRPRRKALRELRYSAPPPCLSAGYYGPRGVEFVMFFLTKSLRDELKALMRLNPLVQEMGETMFVEWVLVPEVVKFFIKIDFGCDEESAWKKLEETALLGELVNNLDDM